jgi:hypothetical protein
LRPQHPPPGGASTTQKQAERFADKYVDTEAKAELLRILAYRPSQFHTLPEILSLTRSGPQDIERAIFGLRGLGVLQLKESPRGPAVALSHNSLVRRIAPALWRHLKRASDRGASDLPS